MLFGQVKYFDNFDFAQQPSSVTDAIANSRPPAGKFYLLIAALAPKGERGAGRVEREKMG